MTTALTTTVIPLTRATTTGLRMRMAMITGTDTITVITAIVMGMATTAITTTRQQASGPPSP
jgi:hypothetical protein